MDQDELEDRLLLDILASHWDLIKTTYFDRALLTLSASLRSSQSILLVSSAFILLLWVLNSDSLGRIHKYLLINSDGILMGGMAGFSFSEDSVFVHAMQGKRPTMEDRFLSCRLATGFGDTKSFVRINTVMDGHGGEVSFIEMK